MQHTIINIGRSLGSGGYTIAKKIADHYKFDFYDKELLQIAAKNSGLSSEFFEKVDEKPDNSFKNFLFSALSGYGIRQLSVDNPLSGESLFRFQSKIIKHLAEKKSCVFVGRCADYILRNNKNCINIFCYAPLQFRIDNVIKRKSMSQKEAEKLIRQGDSQRSEYYNFFTNKDWGATSSYHLLIDTSQLGINNTADFLINYIDNILASRNIEY